jgi:hypothetical protein
MAAEASSSWLTFGLATLGIAGTLTAGMLQGRREERRSRTEWSREHERWHREDKQRWLVEKRAAYVQFLASANEIWNRLFFPGIRASGMPSGDIELLISDLDAATAALLICADDRIREESRKLYELLTNARFLAEETPPTVDVLASEVRQLSIHLQLPTYPTTDAGWQELKGHVAAACQAAYLACASLMKADLEPTTYHPPDNPGS